MRSKSEIVASLMETHETPFGTFHATAPTGGTVKVWPQPLAPGAIKPRDPRRAADQAVRPFENPLLRKASGPRTFYVLIHPDGDLNILLDAGQVIPDHEPSYLTMFEIARRFAVEHASGMRELRAIDRDIHIRWLEWRVMLPVLGADEIATLTRWRGITARAVARLPSAWRDLVRRHGGTSACLREAPSPLGSLVRDGNAANEVEHRVLAILRKVETIDWLVEDREAERARTIRQLDAMRAEATRDRMAHASKESGMSASA